MAAISLGTLRDYWKRVYDWIGIGLEPSVVLKGSLIEDEQAVQGGIKSTS